MTTKPHPFFMTKKRKNDDGRVGGQCDHQATLEVKGKRMEGQEGYVTTEQKNGDTERGKGKRVKRLCSCLTKVRLKLLREQISG